MPADRRLLLVHAHPDDESIGTGATMAKYVADGAHVCLVTCTLGEEGEILVPALAHLAADREDGLGQHRIGEITAAMAALGVTDHRFLGGPGRWRDSGMMGEPSNDRPDCFWQADVASPEPDSPTGELVRIIREVRPQVVVTYDENGGYGHPDHIQAHRVAVAAFEAAGDPARYPDAGEPWQPAKLYYIAVPISILREAFAALKAMGEEAPFGVTEPEELAFGVSDDVITTVVDAREQLPKKLDALRAYPTQIAVDGQFFALSNDIGRGAFGLEHYQLARGAAHPGPDGRETDLFAGLTISSR
ncbi:MAG TPA: N-acetyl-1-D-myo-inositol-2-amino-2-deoxy-alpha-D-glucopyranoside deacetylase [Mycobacteriales bacterium]|nr:N-acetyl-1-D-myo-inositol-2-amino-2-deoxy-alpha-D-glucopyranoside deacetylase [Mycobacteriales bacterium]